MELTKSPTNPQHRTRRPRTPSPNRPRNRGTQPPPAVEPAAPIHRAGCPHGRSGLPTGTASSIGRCTVPAMMTGANKSTDRWRASAPRAPPRTGPPRRADTRYRPTPPRRRRASTSPGSTPCPDHGPAPAHPPTAHHTTKTPPDPTDQQTPPKRATPHDQPPAAALYPHLTHTVRLHLGNASLPGTETRVYTRIIPPQRGIPADAHPHHPTPREQSGLTI